MIFLGLYEWGYCYMFCMVLFVVVMIVVSYLSLLCEVGYYIGFVGKFGVSVCCGECEKMFDEFMFYNWLFYFK